MPTGIYKRTEQHNNNMRLSLKGRILTPEWKIKIGLSNSKPKIKVICKICQKEFYVNQARKYTVKFCSRKCKALFPWPKETKEKMSKANIGKVLDIETRKKISFSLKGSKNYSWKGGITPLYRRIRRLMETIIWRRQIFERDNYTCQKCKKIGGKLVAHHNINSFSLICKEFLKIYSQFSLIEDKETLVRLAITYKPFWDITNGITLCKDCHIKKRGIYHK